MEHLKEMDFLDFPKLKHDLWYSYSTSPEIYYLVIPGASYEVPAREAKEFFPIRTFCTGHFTVEEISTKTGTNVKKIKKMLLGLKDIEAIHEKIISLVDTPREELSAKLKLACMTWRDQLNEMYVVNDIFNLRAHKNIVIGWMLETYHYIRNFPTALKIAADNTEGELKNVLLKYYNQEKGHEIFIEKSLIKMGLTREEVRTSSPLVSTTSIHRQMIEMFKKNPLSVFPVSLMIEGIEFEEDTKEAYQKIALHYGFEKSVFEDFLAHMKIDYELGHGKLFDDNIFLVENIDHNDINDLINDLHDLKHCFDLQTAEIKTYYSRPGCYIPRQYISYFAI